MKKIFAMLLALAMLLGAMAMAEATDVTGTWYAVEMIQGDQSINPAEMGLEITMTLNEDGTATMNGAGDPSEGTWTFDGETLTIQEEGADDTVMTYADGNLTMGDDSMTMVFSQEAPEAEVFAPAAAVEAAVEDFAGTWKAEKIGLEGSYYPVSLLGADITATFEDTTITLDGFLFSNTSIPLEYADGALSVSAADEDSGMAMAVQATLLEDGMLELNLDAGETGAFAFYMVPAEAAEEAPAA